MRRKKGRHDYNRNFKCKAKKVILPLYCTVCTRVKVVQVHSIVRPHLDYCVQAWRPHNRYDIDKRRCREEDMEDMHKEI